MLFIGSADNVYAVENPLVGPVCEIGEQSCPDLASRASVIFIHRVSNFFLPKINVRGVSTVVIKTKFKMSFDV